MAFSAKGATYDIVIVDRASAVSRTISDVHLPMFGQHNVQNALAAVVVANELGFSDEVIRAGLGSFSGVKRRFTKIGESRGVTVIDDYGHHPVEIAAVLRAARQASTGNVIAVVQPHRFTRLQSLFEEFCSCFNDADTVIVADVYAAGEQPIEGVNRDALVSGLLARGHRKAIALTSPAELPVLLHGLAKSGDFIVCLGAGNITTWAHALPAQMDAVAEGRPLPEPGE
jgi:UDP-N-acetylmuramate--alanine ligase